MALDYFGFGKHPYVFLNPLMLKEAPYVKSCNCFNLTILITKTSRLLLCIKPLYVDTALMPGLRAIYQIGSKPQCLVGTRLDLSLGGS